MADRIYDLFIITYAFWENQRNVYLKINFALGIVRSINVTAVTLL